jgi:hypothetical protein
MAPEERYPPDQQFGAEAAKDQERAEEAARTSTEAVVAADVDGKEPRAAGKAEPVEES